MTEIVILGSGFAAVAAVRELRKNRVDAKDYSGVAAGRLVYLPA